MWDGNEEKPTEDLVRARLMGSARKADFKCWLRPWLLPVSFLIPKRAIFVLTQAGGGAWLL